MKEWIFFPTLSKGRIAIASAVASTSALAFATAFAYAFVFIFAFAFVFPIQGSSPSIPNDNNNKITKFFCFMIKIVWLAWMTSEKLKRALIQNK